jgi:hypothetical protein
MSHLILSASEKGVIEHPCAALLMKCKFNGLELQVNTTALS